MSVQETTPSQSRHRRKVEPPPRPYREHNAIFVNQIPLLAAQEARNAPALSTLEKMFSKAGREAGLSPDPEGWIGKRPVYKPEVILNWLDGLVTAKPRDRGIAATIAAASKVKAAPRQLAEPSTQEPATA